MRSAFSRSVAGSAATYLALGDSYTIGETVLLADNFPYQTVELLRRRGLAFHAPEIIAKTGWTTDELADAISRRKMLPAYDIVTLLVGVNNQYRGRSVEEFRPEFQKLLEQAVQFADNNPSHVFVLSIPDWGVTPFAAERDRKQIAKEIDSYNAVCKEAAATCQANYLYITEYTRMAGNDPSLVAADGLHPSAKEYGKWAEDLARLISDVID